MVGYPIGTFPSNIEPIGFCRGASLKNADFSVDKNWKLSERFKLQFRLDFFDVFNHPNFRTDSGSVSGSPIGTVNCGAADCSPANNIITGETKSVNWGQSNQTVGNAGREIQYGLHLTF